MTSCVNFVECEKSGRICRVPGQPSAAERWLFSDTDCGIQIPIKGFVGSPALDFERKCGGPIVGTPRSPDELVAYGRDGVEAFELPNPQ